jgi:hypothetical protein
MILSLNTSIDEIRPWLYFAERLRSQGVEDLDWGYNLDGDGDPVFVVQFQYRGDLCELQPTRQLAIFNGAQKAIAISPDEDWVGLRARLATATAYVDGDAPEPGEDLVHWLQQKMLSDPEDAEDDAWTYARCISEAAAHLSETSDLETGEEPSTASEGDGNQGPIHLPESSSELYEVFDAEGFGSNVSRFKLLLHYVGKVLSENSGDSLYWEAQGWMQAYGTEDSGFRDSLIEGWSIAVFDQSSLQQAKAYIQTAMQAARSMSDGRDTRSHLRQALDYLNSMG